MSKLIPLHNRKGEIIANAIVDDADFDWLTQHSWCLNACGYALRTLWITRSKSVALMMHRAILDVTDKRSLTDHINGNRLDNRRENLRECTASQNAMNRPPRRGSSSRYKGVGWHKLRQKWQAFVCVNKRKIYLGIYESEIDAALAHDAAVRQYHGEFSKLNFPYQCSSCGDPIDHDGVCPACQAWIGVAA